MITCKPAARIARIFNKFILIEFPYYVAVPVNLDNIKAVLHTEFTTAASSACHKVPAGENFIGHTVNALPDIYFMSVHIHKHSANFLSLKDGVPAPAFFRFEYGNTCGVNCWMAHIKFLQIN